VTKLALRVGDHHVGLATTSLEVAVAARGAFAAQLVEDPEVPANLSIHAGTDPLRGSRSSYRVDVGCERWATTDSLDRALEAVHGFLQEFETAHPHRPGQLVVQATVLHSDDGAVMLPSGARHRCAVEQRRLERRGVRLANRAKVLVDVAARRCWVAAGAAEADHDRPVELRRWFVDAGTQPSRAELLVAAFAHVREHPDLPLALLELQELLPLVRSLTSEDATRTVVEELSHPR
jgi:hypothetical protein